MADYYLLESGSGHYELESGSGSLLLETGWGPFAINFRNTAAFVTDNAGETHLVGGESSGNYPPGVTRVPTGQLVAITMGTPNSPPGTNFDPRDRGSGAPIELAGIFQQGNVSGPGWIVVEVPAAGQYTLGAVMGDVRGGNNQEHYWSIVDSDQSTILNGPNHTSTSGSQWADLAGNLYTVDATALAGAQANTITVTLSGKKLYLKWGDPAAAAGNSSTIAYLQITQVPPTGANNGIAAITEGADAAAGVGTDQVAGAAAITEGQDTVAGVGTDKVSGAAAITEGADVAAGVGTDSVTGVAGITEGADSAAGVGTAGNNGTAAITESADAAAGVGTDQVAGAAAISETADTAAGVGTDSVTGTAAISEGADAAAGAGTDSVSGIAGITEGVDTPAGVGTASTEDDGVAAITEAADTAAGAGTNQVSGVAAINEDPDTCAGVGNVPSAMAQPAAAGGAGVPGWYGPEDLAAAKPIGPHKRPGQVFGEQDPFSPSLSSRAPLVLPLAPRQVDQIVLTPPELAHLTPEQAAALLALFIELG